MTNKLEGNRHDRRALNNNMGATQFLDIDDICDLTGYSRSTIYLHIKDDKFPPGIMIGQWARRWTVDEYNLWAQERIDSAAELGRIAGDSTAGDSTAGDSTVGNC